MGRRSGGEPQHGQAPLRRILHALNMLPIDLAVEIEADFRYRPMIHRLILDLADEPLNSLPELDTDVWERLQAYVTKQQAYLMAAKADLDALTERQLARRALRIRRLDNLNAASAPASLPRRQLPAPSSSSRRR